MIKKAGPLIFLFSVVIFLTLLWYCQGHQTLNPTKSGSRYPYIKAVTIKGEVVDSWCYASQTMGPGRGKSHKACALKCVGGGITPGILEDGSGLLYLAVKYRGFQGCNELLLPYVGEKVKVKGWVGSLGGQRVLRIQKLELLDKAQSAEDSKNRQELGNN